MKRTPLTRRAPLRRTEFRPKSHPTKGKIPDEVREAVKRRSGGRCEIIHPDCSTTATQMHHVLRRSQGGPHAEGNLLHLCRAGHGYVHANPALSYERGWLARGT